MSDFTGQTFDRYQLLESLGGGGMAEVYKAYDTRLKTHVAVKIISTDKFIPAVLPKVLKRFEREAETDAQLTHPNIVSIIDYGEHEGVPYLVMEYLPGGTLKDRLQGRPLPWRDALRLLLPIARALQFSHDQGIIHRDVKPSNILITLSGEPMLSDFGIAKILESESSTTLTGTGVGIGTAEYMAPEQWTGKTSPRSDMYSLGVVLYEMVTGSRPFTADTPAEILLKQANEPLPRPRQFAPDLPDRVEKVILKALAKKPEDRYSSMQEFITALEGLLSGQTKTKQSVFPWKKAKAEKSPEPEQDIPTVRKPIRDQSTLDARLLADGKPKEPVFSTIEPSKTRLASPPTPPGEASQQMKFKIRPAWTIALVGLVALVAFAVWGPHLLAVRPPYSSTPSAIGMTMSSVLTKTQFSTETPIPTAMPTDTPMPTFTLVPTLGIGSTWTRPADGMTMVYVLAGSFTMGATVSQAMTECRNVQNYCWSQDFSDEQPPHSVTLYAYWIDKNDVTNAMYAKCMQAGACQSPSAPFLDFPRLSYYSYYGNTQYDNYPVVQVNWNDAQAYCQWAGARLPTEAEWEKAARGTDGRIYPWGNDNPTCSLANFSSGCVNGMRPVGSYPSGASPYGALDMAGNVWQWVNDWYGASYYASSPLSNPQGPVSGLERVLRGGAWGGWWYNIVDDVRSANRRSYNPAVADRYTGFRCARSTP